jgi:predicted anti-sigma-YlaC factor YlaD
MHLDGLDLDAARAGEAAPEERAHVEACAACRAAVEALRILGERLKARSRIEVPPGMDRAILSKARRRVLRFPAWIAAAAAAAIALAAIPWIAAGRTEPADVDRNGVVDIVDAYRLALRLASGEPVDERLDLDGSGAVDAADVRRLAQRAVSLKGS